MKEIEILTFEKAINETHPKNRILVLGNGFSIAWNSSIFSYKSLKESAEKLDERTKTLFHTMDTVDFEELIRAYEYASHVCNVYGIENEFSRNASELRTMLIETIAKSHPEFPGNILSEEYENCIKFLSNFKSIYTLNYDMLLYWRGMVNKFKSSGQQVFTTTHSPVALRELFVAVDEVYSNLKGLFS